jgi:hypothetical protein
MVVDSASGKPLFAHYTLPFIFLKYFYCSWTAVDLWDRCVELSTWLYIPI